MNTTINAAQLADVFALMATALRSQAQPGGSRVSTPPAGDGVTGPAPNRPALRDSLIGAGQPVIINAARFVTIEMCAAITGLTRSAINKRMGRGYWIEGRQWRRAEDGRIWIDMQAVERWVQGMP